LRESDVAREQAITTSLITCSKKSSHGLIPEPYAAFPQRVMADFQKPGLVTHESDVAETVWRAANDATGQLRFPAVPDAVALAQFR
jgi:hypothetical protein